MDKNNNTINYKGQNVKNNTNDLIIVKNNNISICMPHVTHRLNKLRTKRIN